MSPFDPKAFLRDIVRQDADALRGYFLPDAIVCWHNTNERFTAGEYIRANCEYPGDWDGEVERVEVACSGAVLVVVARVWDDAVAARVTSFIQLANGMIERLDEYWGDVGEPPGWRKAMGIGKAVSG